MHAPCALGDLPVIEISSDEDRDEDGELPVVDLQKRVAQPDGELDLASTGDDSIISLHDNDSIVVNTSQKISTARLVPGVETGTAKFPSSFYAVNLHKAFSTFKATNRLRLETQFENFFQLPWKSSTYYNHRARWLNVPHDARDNAVTAEYTEDGQYSRFLAVHAAKDAEVKAAKRKL
ncbi:hypothetical protein L210DRAFT_3505619 [Boletus edulis BED1]|uniref:Uncharacterized protein n=1 Tax=Boletus edulis BED1 TaxID=1328754 RepID=A0AAD4BQP2_BOLED|nr:hypothetical protein L210DRAFT_3505619 [Boletus edulis BED1]